MDVPEVLEHYWQQLGLTLDPVKSAEAANTITRITGGNFRLIERIMSQVRRLMSINDLHTISPVSSDVLPVCRPDPSQPPDRQQFPNDPLKNRHEARPHPA